MENYNYPEMRFLIVDNIKPSQDILKQFAMRLTRIQVDSTHYAQDVPTICQQQNYDVILLGYDLGDNQKNGQQVLEELRINNYIDRHCVVILITAEVSQAMVLAALEHKPDHYLCKPYSLQDLHNRLHSCIRKKKSMAVIYQALDQQQPDLVIKRCDIAISQSTPYKTECQGIKSRQLFELKEITQAEEIYNYYKMRPHCQWANIGLGKIALYEKRFSDAESIFKLLIKKYPLYLSSYDWLAITYQEQFLFLFAEETLEQALALSPRSLTRLKKFAQLCLRNEHFDKATFAYERTHKLAKNSVHYSSDNTINYTQALIEYSPSLTLTDAKRVHNKAFSFLKQMTKDFKEIDVKVHSHLLSACLFEITKEHSLANDEFLLGENLLLKEQENIPEEKLFKLSKTLQKVNKTRLHSQILLPSSDESEEDKLTTNLSDKLFNNGIKDKAQKALEYGLTLYHQKKYSQSVVALEKALKLYPGHLGIKFNLLQALLRSLENNKHNQGQLNTAESLLIELSALKYEAKDLLRLKKMQKKYQLLAGI